MAGMMGRLALEGRGDEMGWGGGRMIGFASGSLAVGVFSAVPTVLLLYFCTQIVAIPAATAAAIMFVPKIWSILWDPLVGAWSDRYRSSLGRRKPFILVGGIGTALAFVALFSWPYSHDGADWPIVAAFYFLLATAYSIFAVPYVACPAEVKVSPARRERIVGWRIGFGMAGLLIGSAAVPMLIAALGGGQAAYQRMSLIVVAICGGGVLLAFRAIPSIADVGRPVAGAAGRIWERLLQAVDYRHLLLAYLVMIAGVSLQLALTAYWIVFAGESDEAFVGLVIAGMMGATILATPLWTMIMARLGAKRTALVAATAYAGASFLLLFVAPAVMMIWAPPLFVLIGATFAGIQVAPFSLVAHLIHADAGDGVQGNEALLSGIWTAGEKVGLACGSGLAGLSLATFGFVSGAGRQSDATVEAIGWLIGVGPALLVVMGCLILIGVRPPQDVR